SGIGGLEDALATHGKGTEIEIACAGIDSVMIAGIDGNTVDGRSGNQRIVGYHAPASGITTTVGRLPYAASDRPQISHNAAIHYGGWIDRYRVHSPFGRRVVKTTRAAGHAFWLRAEADKPSGNERQRA